MPESTPTLESLEREHRTNQLQMEVTLQRAEMQALSRALALDSLSRSFGSAGPQDAMESVYTDDYVNPQDYLRESGYQTFGSTYTTKNDRKDGDNYPHWTSETELASIRGVVRLIATYNKTCIGINRKLCNYVVGDKGFARKVISKRGAPDELLKACETILDEFDERNQIPGDLDREYCRRDVRDGELGPSLWHRGDGLVDLRTVEPDQVSEPTNPGELEDWLRTENQMGNDGVSGLPFASSWSYGVHTTKSDVCAKHGYYVQWDSDTSSWDYMPGGNEPCYPPASGMNTWMELWKANTDRNIKRGVSDYFAMGSDFELARKLMRNLTHAGALQSSIAWIREMAPGVTKQQITDSSLSYADRVVQRDTSSGTRTSYQVDYRPGTSLAMPSSQKFTKPPWTEQGNALALISIFEAMLRSIGQIWSMPEHMITGSAANNNYACHDEKTELLTKRGWLRFDEIQFGDVVATMNPKTKMFEWQELQDIHIYDHKGEMVALKSKHNFDQLVTPNHRMFFSSEGIAGREAIRDHKEFYQFKEASDLEHGDYLPTACDGKTVDSTPKFVVIPAVNHNRSYKNQLSHPSDVKIPLDVFLKYLGWWVSEGWISETNPDHGTYKIGISQKIGSDECVEIESTHASMPYSHRYYDRSNGMRTWYIYDKSLLAWLKENCGSGAYDKKLPEFVHGLPAYKQEILLKALVSGDGTSHKSGSMHYFTVSKQLADNVQSLAIQCGYASHVEKPMSNGVIPISIRAVNKRGMLKSKHIRSVPYAGKVWCVTVPNGIAITRRNGKMAITGNSILEAGSPFVKEIEARQGRHIKIWTSIYWKVLWFNWRIGRLGKYSWEDIRYAVEIQLTGPQVDVRDRLKETQRNSIMKRDGILSPVTYGSREGLDYDDEMKLGAKQQEPQVPSFGLGAVQESAGIDWRAYP
jgi:hypothetical protein